MPISKHFPRLCLHKQGSARTPSHHFSAVKEPKPGSQQGPISTLTAIDFLSSIPTSANVVCSVGWFPGFQETKLSSDQGAIIAREDTIFLSNPSSDPNEGWSVGQVRSFEESKYDSQHVTFISRAAIFLSNSGPNPNQGWGVGHPLIWIEGRLNLSAISGGDAEYSLKPSDP
jgi:hypothetical protein